MYALTIFYLPEANDGATYIHQTLEAAQEEMKQIYDEYLELEEGDGEEVFEKSFTPYNAYVISDNDHHGLKKMEMFITAIYE